MLQAPAHFHSRAVLTVRQGVLLLVAIALGLLPGLASVPPIDRDEPRYTQATKQMIETGDFVTINFQDAARNKKPIGIHWLQAGAVALSGLGADAPVSVYRIPSLVGAIAAMLLAVWAARAFLPLPAAILAGALLGATIIVGVEARLAKTDAVLLATVIAAQGALARIWLGQARGLAMPLVLWVALGLGILVKGPIAPMVLGLTVAALALMTGRALLARLRPLLGLLVVAVICLPWFVAIWIETDGQFFANALGRDFIGKAATGQEGHGAPPLTHLATFFAVGWPLAPFALAAAVLWRRARAPALTFALAWALPSWIVWEAIPTKLPHYTLPLVPAIALAAVATLSVREPPRVMAILAAVLIALIPLAAVVATVALPFGVAQATGADTSLAAVFDPLSFALALVPAAMALVAAVALVRGAPILSARVVGSALIAAVLAQAVAWGVVLPRLEPVWVSSRLVAAARAATACERPHLVSIGYREPSMIFLAGTDTVLTSPSALEGTADPCTVLAVEQASLDEFTAATAARGMALRRTGTVEGFNISKGDPVRLTLFVPG